MYLHYHLARTFSTDIDIQYIDTSRRGLLESATKEPPSIPKHKPVDEKWANKYEHYTVSLRSAAPQLRFCDIFEPVSVMLQRLDLSEDKMCGVNEIQNQFYMLFGTYIPSTNLESTLIDMVRLQVQTR